jgi:arginine:ornithine antiporter/lysine permease
MFIVILAVTLQGGIFTGNFWGDGGDSSLGGLFDQVKATMLVTVFVFLGVEGASVYSRYARRRSDVGRATVLGFVSVLALFASVTLLSYGALPRADLEGLQQPSMAGVLEAVVGGWGSTFIGIGLIVSVLGAYLAWTLMAAEVLYVAAKDDDMPAFLKRANRQGSPTSALVLTSSLITAVLAVTLFSDDAFTFTLKLCSSLSLVPYLLAAGFALKLAVQGETYDAEPQGRRRELVIAAVAVVYTIFLIFAAGLEFLLLSCIIYAPGTVLFVLTRREHGRRPFSLPEAMLLAGLIAGAVAGLIGLIAGWITI